MPQYGAQRPIVWIISTPKLLENIEIFGSAGVDFHSFPKQIFVHKLWSGSKGLQKSEKIGPLAFTLGLGLHNDSNILSDGHFWKHLLVCDQGSIKWMLNTHLNHRFYYGTVTAAFHTLSLFIVKLTTLWVSEAFVESVATAVLLIIQGDAEMS